MADKYLSRKSKTAVGDKQKLIIQLEGEMKEAARTLDFERAAELRDIIYDMKAEE